MTKYKNDVYKYNDYENNFSERENSLYEELMFMDEEEREKLQNSDMFKEIMLLNTIAYFEENQDEYIDILNELSDYEPMLSGLDGMSEEESIDILKEIFESDILPCYAEEEYENFDVFKELLNLDEVFNMEEKYRNDLDEVDYFEYIEGVEADEDEEQKEFA
jgi:hypothetical protein